MSGPARRRRLARTRRHLQQPKLNLVALMDIFTILVLFLMVNNGDVEVLQADRHIELPESVSEQRPEAALTIKVSDADIVVQGRRIAGVDEALAADGDTIPALVQELNYQASRTSDDAPEEGGHPVVIMGDQGMPYELLKRIMTTCAGSDYRDISLAVSSNPPGEAPEPLLASRGESL